MLAAAIILILTGILGIYLGIRSRRGLSMNGLWGLRTDKTMADEESFTKANRAVWGTYILQGGAFILTGLIGVVLVLRGNDDSTAWGLSVIGVAVFSVIICVYSIRKGHKAIS